MTDGPAYIQVATDGSGKKVATQQVTVGGDEVQRQELVLAGTAEAEVVIPIDEAPTGSEYAIPTRNIPYGTQSVVLTAGTAAVGKLAANTGVDIGDVDVTSVVPGYAATNLGKRRGDAAGTSDVGVAALAVFHSGDEHVTADNGDYAYLSVNDFRELRVRDQRAIDLANCNAYTDYTVLGNDTANLANSTNHVFGSGAITFDKVNGADNTVYAGVYKSFTAINVAEIFEAGGFVGLGCYLSSLSNVVNVFLRIGTDASNYNCWTWPAASLTAATWLNLRTAAAMPTYAKNAGNGWNTSSISYVAFGVEFSGETNTLSGILFDHVHLVGGRITASDISTSVTSSVNTPNVNINRVGGTATDTNNGTVSAGTLRVTVASDSTGQLKSNIVPATSGGLSISRVISAASTNATVVKGSAGQVYGWSMSNVNAQEMYVKLYNKATAPTVGSDTPVITLLVPGGATGLVSEASFPQGIAFGTGIGLAITGAVADNDTTAVAANEIVVNLFYS